MGRGGKVNGWVPHLALKGRKILARGKPTAQPRVKMGRKNVCHLMNDFDLQAIWQTDAHVDRESEVSTLIETNICCDEIFDPLLCESC